MLAVVTRTFVVGATACSVFGASTGFVGLREAFGMLRWIVIVGSIAMLVAPGVLIATLVTESGPGRTLAIAAVLLILGPVGAIIGLRHAPPLGPPINDITTDLEDPPRFEHVRAVRPPRANPLEHGGAAVAARQREAHPEVVPILSSLAPEEAFRRAAAVAEAMGWEIVARDSAAGIIEAVDTTPVFRFKDDVVVRVRPAPGGSRVDLRSLSRVGRSDLGKNAARIVEFSERFARD